MRALYAPIAIFLLVLAFPPACHLALHALWQIFHWVDAMVCRALYLCSVLLHSLRMSAEALAGSKRFPEVQPPLTLLPKPTSKPATITTIQLAGISGKGTGKSAKLPLSGAMISPPVKAMRQLLSPAREHAGRSGQPSSASIKNRRI